MRRMATDLPHPLNPTPLPRQGPRPLLLHLMTALCVWLSLPIAWRNLNNISPSLSSNLTNPEPLARLKNLRGAQSEPDPAFLAALNDEAVRRARRFMTGIRAYQNHPALRHEVEAPVIWQKGTTRLRDYNPSSPAAPIILIIPSLINRFTILDLNDPFSFVRVLAARGYRPLVVDWDVPGDAEKDFSVSDYILSRLIPMLDFVGTPVHVLGYCMGGLLALALAALQPAVTKTLTLMATPWDFHQPDPTRGEAFHQLVQQVEPILQSSSLLPVDVIQTLFASFQPLRVLEKFYDFAAMDATSAEARHFVLLEDWLNDGVPLTAPVARECLHDWYGDNVTARGTWRVGTTLIDPRQMMMPSYLIVPGKDHIVPPESALPLAKLLPHATLHEPMMGHVGLMAGRKAPQQVWAPLLYWLDEHC